VPLQKREGDREGLGRERRMTLEKPSRGGRRSTAAVRRENNSNFSFAPRTLQSS
jgi:hypothetical protein